MVHATVARTVVRYLGDYGIETAFGIPGLYNMPLFEALRDSDIRVITVRHEQGAAFMADGYARATGRPAAVITLPGCGVLNALTALGEAYADSSPVLLLSSQIPVRHIDRNRGLLHELTGQFDVVGSVMKYGERLYVVDDAGEVIRRALIALGSRRPRPVQIELPVDVQDELTSAPDNCGASWAARRNGTAEPPFDEQALDDALAEVVAAQNPLVIAGGGVVSSDASTVLVSVAERLGAPVLTTGMGVGTIPSDHALACGVSWIASADVTDLIGAADAVVAVGTRFNDGMTNGWDLPLPPTTLRVDIDAEEVERNFVTKYRIVGDARRVLAQAQAWLVQRSIDRGSVVGPKMAQAQQAYRRAQYDRVGDTRPWFEALRAALPRDGVIAADMSLFWADMLGSFPVTMPRQVLFPWGMSTLGFGIPAAVGAKIGIGDRPVVSIVGDGAFQFTGAELGTAVQEGLALPIVVANNNAYGMIKMQQLNKYGEHVGMDLRSPDFVALARAYGARGALVGSPDELFNALASALAADGPTVIEIPWGTRFARQT
jgi:acetolactate synthase-1/2/3 large subunit